MTRAAAMVLKRMRCNPSDLYLHEIVQGCKHHDPTLTSGQVLDGLCELQELGMALPATWRLTEDGRGPTPLPSRPSVSDTNGNGDLAQVVQLAGHPSRARHRASRRLTRSLDFDGADS